MAKQSPELKRDIMPYRDCAGCVVFNSKGQVLICERKSKKQGKHIWQFPQGGIDSFEEPIDAALRELYEETSIRSVSLLTAATDWIYYDLPDEYLGIALKGKFRGQRQKWFAFLFEGSEDEINVINPANGEYASEFSNWRWEKLKKTPKLIVPFKQEAYKKIVSAFEHIVINLKEKSTKVKALKSKHLNMWVELRHKYSPQVSRKNHRAESLALLKSKKAKSFGLFEGDILIGFAEVYKKQDDDGSDIAWLNGIFITQGYRQWDLDKKLLQSVEKWAKKKNLNKINSQVSLNNERAISSHIELGFAEVKRVVKFSKQL